MSPISADELAGSLQQFVSCLKGLSSPLSPQQVDRAQQLATHVAQMAEAATGRPAGDLTTLRS